MPRKKHTHLILSRDSLLQNIEKFTSPSHTTNGLKTLNLNYTNDDKSVSVCVLVSLVSFPC